MTCRISIMRWLAACSVLLCQWPATAQDDGGRRIYVENDFFNPFTEQTDRYYTQALRYEVMRRAKDTGEENDFLPTVDYNDWCIFCGDLAEEGFVSTGYAVGQNIYTPADITIARRQTFDRPYAGFLYGSRIAAIVYPEEVLQAQRMDRVDFTLGIVGPIALAGETQRAWHRLIGDDRPAGWRHQLRNEPIVQLRYETALRWPAQEGGHADFIPRVGANLGNAFISADVELRGRIGFNLKGFGVDRIVAASPAPLAAEGSVEKSANQPIASKGSLIRSFAIFARVKGSAVARNIFLDGNSFRDNDIRINSKTFIGEFGFGIETQIGPLSLTAQFVRRGSEFEDLRGFEAPHQDFGSLTVGFPL